MRGCRRVGVNAAAAVAGGRKRDSGEQVMVARWTEDDLYRRSKGQMADNGGLR